MVTAPGPGSLLAPGVPSGTTLPWASNHMSGTFALLTPVVYEVVSPAGVIHWLGVPSLIHGVAPPCRWTTVRFCVYISATMLWADVVASAPGSAGSVTWKWEPSVTLATAKLPL